MGRGGIGSGRNMIIKSVCVIGGAGFLGRHIVRQLAARGVEIRLMHAGTPSSAALMELKKALPKNLIIRRCPRLHTKTVVIDAQRMYIGSANLTGAGMGAKADGRRNFEMGVWTKEPAMIDAVLGEFNALWEGHRCESCKRKDICPEPLEEPPGV